jgi:PAS domain S-box-containing protein
MHKILIAEDEAVIAIELERTLVAMGHEVVGRASSGEEAVDLARCFKPDVIIMDVAMPGKMDGIAAAEAIRQKLDIPVIFLTAHAQDDVIQRAKLAEPLGYILKPFQEEQIRAAVDVAVHKSYMESQLRESEAKYRRIVNTAQEGIYVVDTEVRIDFVNRQLADMLGYTVADMLGHNLIDFMDEFAPVDVSQTVELGDEDIKKPHDFRFRCKDGSVLWGMVSSSAIYDEDGRFVGGLGMVIDVTERKKAERALRKTNEELRSFIDTVSHDLKNPIFSIRGFSTLLQRTYGKKLEKKGCDYLQLIDASARQMNHLVSDLLTLSRIGQVVSNFASIIFSGIVDKAVSTLQGRISEKKIELVVAQNLPVIYCDGERMYQVVENLLSNAIRFAGEGNTPRIEIGYKDMAEYHEFYVSDNGRGVEPRHHRKIFEMFYRINDAGNKQGTGLGLAIVDRIIRQHGGKVWVESEKGKGAKFYFTVPK